MKRYWSGSRRVLGFVPLALACTLTVWRLAQWDELGFSWLFQPVFWLWVAIVIGWTWRLIEFWANKQPWPRRMKVVPLCLAALLSLQLAHLPLRILFWTHQNALQRALARPTLGRQLHSKAPRIGLFRPLQIEKSNGATRFILWENEDFLSGSAVGFAHCPKRDGCSSASFDSFYEDFQTPPQTLRMNDEWIAVSLYGSDF